LPGTGFVANGPVGGPFNLSPENFMLTNPARFIELSANTLRGLRHTGQRHLAGP